MTGARLLGGAEWGRWDTFVERHPQSSIAHTSKWFRLLRDAYGVRPRYLMLENDRGDIIAGLPLVEVRSWITGARLSCLPCAQACNPLAETVSAQQALLEKAERLRQELGCEVVELKLDASYPFQLDRNGSIDTSYCTFVLDLAPDLAQIEAGFHASCIRRPLRKALKGTMELAVGRSEKDVRHFYTLYAGMRKQKGLLPQPFGFFADLWRLFHAEGGVEVLHAKVDGRVISSLILLRHNNTVTYEYGASVPKYLGLHPSIFLLWHSIQRAKEAGYRYFDFGRCHESARGLIQYKQRWGTERRELKYHYVAPGRGHLHVRQNSRLRRIMQGFASSMPSSVCSLAGRLAYRHLI